MDRELLLLGLLRQQEMHGYQLHEFIERDLPFCTDLKKPTAYLLLDKMATAGWIAQRESQAGNRPPRRVFHITQQGEAEFQRLLRENLARYEPARFAGDIGLAFVEALPRDEALALLAERRGALQAELSAARAAPSHRGGSQLVVEHRVRHLQAELEWLDAVMARLRPPAQDGAAQSQL